MCAFAFAGAWIGLPTAPVKVLHQQQHKESHALPRLFVSFQQENDSSHLKGTHFKSAQQMKDNQRMIPRLQSVNICHSCNQERKWKPFVCFVGGSNGGCTGLVLGTITGELDSRLGLFRWLGLEGKDLWNIGTDLNRSESCRRECVRVVLQLSMPVYILEAINFPKESRRSLSTFSHSSGPRQPLTEPWSQLALQWREQPLDVCCVKP